MEQFGDSGACEYEGEAIGCGCPGSWMGNAIIEEEDFEVSVGISVPELELDGVVRGTRETVFGLEPES